MRLYIYWRMFLPKYPQKTLISPISCQLPSGFLSLETPNHRATPVWYTSFCQVRNYPNEFWSGSIFPILDQFWIHLSFIKNSIFCCACELLVNCRNFSETHLFDEMPLETLELVLWNLRNLSLMLVFGSWISGISIIWNSFRIVMGFEIWWSNR